MFVEKNSNVRNSRLFIYHTIKRELRTYQMLHFLGIAPGAGDKKIHVILNLCTKTFKEQNVWLSALDSTFLYCIS